MSSVLLALEARRTLVRLAREHTLTEKQFKTALDRVAEDASLFILRDLTLDLCESMVLPAVQTPRSHDLAHIRTALWFHQSQSITRFVTLDRTQRDAARELGLPV